MSGDDKAELLNLVATMLNGGSTRPSHKAWHARQRAADVLNAIEDAGFMIQRNARACTDTTQ